MARLFVGIPTFDRPDLVLATIASLRAQSFRDWRAIVSDNGSSPGIRTRIEAAISALHDPRIVFHRQPFNGDEYGQGRFLFEEARDADYFMILHDDDLLRPPLVERAVAALDAAPDVALYVANAWLIDRHGRLSPERTIGHRHARGRDHRRLGRFPILDAHLATSFTPISGTVFRTASLRQAGLTDSDCHGNFPFECNVMLRLGDIGAVGWFDPAALIDMRFHPASPRNMLGLMNNPQVVRTMLKLFGRRRYDGANEQRRQVIVSRLHRADALIRLRAGDGAGGRAALRDACRANPRSVKAWALRPLAPFAALWLDRGGLAR
ncbi:MAG TPA: glycosyltransferase family 2 protein [Sphingomonas sp.]